MAEYIEREALLKKMEKWHTQERLIDCVKDTPAADVVEVVYCKNCKHLMFYDFYGECTKGYMGIVQPNDYCSLEKIISYLPLALQQVFVISATK